MISTITHAHTCPACFKTIFILNVIKCHAVWAFGQWEPLKGLNTVSWVQPETILVERTNWAWWLSHEVDEGGLGF